VKLDLGTLQAFSAALLALADVARSAPPERMINDALLALRPLVPFRSAWWGECSNTDAQDMPRNWLHGRINLSASFAQEWNRIADGDAFAIESMRNLGTVKRFSGHDDPNPDVAAFSRRHALDHAMAITVELPGSGLLFFAALYRGDASPAFDDGDSALFAEFFAHLLHHWRMRVRELLLGARPRASDAFALADAHGNLLYLGARLGGLLHEHHPAWDGSALPAELASMVARAPAVVALGAHRLTLQPCGELVTLALERGGRAARLPPRERSVAMLYAQGRSYKEIARLLGLSPATVRTYLRSVYVQLGVRNKIELSGALDPAPRAHR
jgi:DNA-binding CsgD family transcriptional regulator